MAMGVGRALMPSVSPICGLLQPSRSLKAPGQPGGPEGHPAWFQYFIIADFDHHMLQATWGRMQIGGVHDAIFRAIGLVEAGPVRREGLDQEIGQPGIERLARLVAERFDALVVGSGPEEARRERVEGLGIAGRQLEMGHGTHLFLVAIVSGRARVR